MHLFRLHYEEFVSEIGSFFLAFFSSVTTLQMYGFWQLNCYELRGSSS